MMEVSHQLMRQQLHTLERKAARNHSVDCVLWPTATKAASSRAVATTTAVVPKRLSSSNASLTAECSTSIYVCAPSTPLRQSVHSQLNDTYESLVTWPTTTVQKRSQQRLHT